MPKTKEQFEEEVKISFPDASAEEVNKLVEEMLAEAKAGDSPANEYSVYVNIKHYVKIQASSKEEAFEKLKAYDFGQYIESPKDVRWHGVKEIS